jgi:hypothetical protein
VAEGRFEGFIGSRLLGELSIEEKRELEGLLEEFPSAKMSSMASGKPTPSFVS